MNLTKEVSMCIYRVNKDGNNNNQPKKRLDRGNSRAPELNPPVISDIGQYFDVRIILVFNPGYFIVQPLNNANELKVRINKYFYDIPVYVC